MQRKYENLNAEQLREMCLNSEIDVDFMAMEDYEKLFGYEMELDEPQADVLIFCTNGLDKYEKYRNDAPKPSLDKIFKEHYRWERKKFVLKATQLAASVVAVVAITALLAQGVSMALGFDLFGYVYNWFKPHSIEISTVTPDKDEIHDWREIRTTANNSDFTDEPIGNDQIIIEDYDRIEDISDEWLSRVSPWILERYEFSSAQFMNLMGDIEFVIYFTDDSDNNLILTVQNKPMIYVEREDELYVDEIEVNGIKFAIFKNIEDYQVMWSYDDMLHILNAHLPLDEVKGIVEGYY